jgi:hypothetical protein
MLFASPTRAPAAYERQSDVHRSVVLPLIIGIFTHLTFLIALWCTFSVLHDLFGRFRDQQTLGKKGF